MTLEKSITWGKMTHFSHIFKRKDTLQHNEWSRCFKYKFKSTVLYNASQYRLAAIIPVINPLSHLQFTRENLRLNGMMQQKNEILSTKLRKEVDNT